MLTLSKAQLKSFRAACALFQKNEPLALSSDLTYTIHEGCGIVDMIPNSYYCEGVYRCRKCNYFSCAKVDCTCNLTVNPLFKVKTITIRQKENTIFIKSFDKWFYPYAKEELLPYLEKMGINDFSWLK